MSVDSALTRTYAIMINPDLFIAQEAHVFFTAVRTWLPYASVAQLPLAVAAETTQMEGIGT